MLFFVDSLCSECGGDRGSRNPYLLKNQRLPGGSARNCRPVEQNINVNHWSSRLV